MFFLLSHVPADAVRVVEARPVKEQDGLVVVRVRVELALLELRLLGPEPLRQGFVLHVGEPDGRLGQPPFGFDMVDVVDKIHVAFQATEIIFPTDLANLCLGALRVEQEYCSNGTKDGGITVTVHCHNLSIKISPLKVKPDTVT